MSGPPRIHSTNVADSEPEPRPVLVPATNKSRPVESRKPAAKPQNNAAKPPPQETESKHKKLPSPLANMPQCVTAASILRRRDSEGLMNLSMSASCSSDASSSDSSHSRASSGRAVVGRRSAPMVRRKQCGSKAEIEKVGNESGVGVAIDGLDVKKRCAWITSNTDPCYIAFHDEEWGVPVHDDKKLFELLSLSGALAELTWPVILNKRHIFREVFLDFDPFSVSKLNEKKITTLGIPANSLLSEIKLRAVIENARQICKVINEFGSFDKYMWNFVKHKPIINQFRYHRQIPVKNSKAEVISKDLVRRGFRSVGPTVIYSFMQVAGLSNDHLISCFRYQECITSDEAREKDDGLKAKVEEENHKVSTDIARAIDDLNISPQ